ncbi:hypothetical protein HYT57_00165 [Candidatus Woesearchaeota archaeon]|nr:hypothetical protein [Candidatus Woesearchaeota archaeon]
MRSRVYESQSIVLEVEVTVLPIEVGRYNTFSGIPCIITSVNHTDFKYMLNEPAVIEWHHSGLREFSKGDKLRVYATPKEIEHLTVTYPRRIDAVDEKGKVKNRHFC